MTKKRIKLVVKLGTDVLCSNGSLDQKIFNELARQIVESQIFAYTVVISSGAIKAGSERMKELNNFFHDSNKKGLASIGARHLMNNWGKAFEKYEQEVAQIWVTYANWLDNSERRNIDSAVFNFWNHGQITPIINENDVVADDEIKTMELGISENDKLAQMVAELVNADAVLFLTKSEGIYENDPTTNLNVRLYSEIDVQTAKKIANNPSAKSLNGKGGIKAKIDSAISCFELGKRVAISGLDSKDVIYRFAKGESVNTTFGALNRFS